MGISEPQLEHFMEGKKLDTRVTSAIAVVPTPVPLCQPFDPIRGMSPTHACRERDPPHTEHNEQLDYRRNGKRNERKR